MILFFPKHIEYDYYDYTFRRTTFAQNTTVFLSIPLYKLRAAILDFILIS